MYRQNSFECQNVRTMLLATFSGTDENALVTLNTNQIPLHQLLSHPINSKKWHLLDVRSSEDRKNHCSFLPSVGRVFDSERQICLPFVDERLSIGVCFTLR